jgi:hypothetical protein
VRHQQGPCPGFAVYSVANWEAIDGKNDWSDHDAVVIFGLLYRDPVWATNTFFALQGLQHNRWLEQPVWSHYADVRQEMQRRQLTVSVIQAVTRPKVPPGNHRARRLHTTPIRSREPDRAPTG